MATVVPFLVNDIFNRITTSGYALTATPLFFSVQPRELSAAGYSSRRIVWEFDDGTTSTDLSAEHAFKLPGRYSVKLYAQDASGTLIRTNSVLVVIQHPLPNITTIVSPPISSLESGQTITLTAYSYRTDAVQPLPIHSYLFDTVNVSGDAPSAQNIDDVNLLTQPYYGVFETTKESSASNVYAKFVNDTIQLQDFYEDGTQFVGTSSLATVEFTSHFLGTRQSVTAYINTKNLEKSTPDSFGLHSSDSMNYFSPPYLLPPVVESIPVSSYISINGSTLGVYKFPSYVYTDVKYPIVLKKVSSNGNDILDTITTSSWSTSQVVCLDSNLQPTTDIQVETLYTSGYALTGNLIALSASINKDYTLIWEGSSINFTVLSSKESLCPLLKNENIDALDMIKGQIHSEVILSYDTFLNDYVGTILGTDTSPSNAIGRRVYEKIANFTQNHIDTDVCTINALQSMMSMMGVDDTEGYLGSPADLDRVLNLISIKQSVAWGARTQFTRDFGSIPLPGRNRGRQYSVTENLQTSSISAGIVVYDKYRESFELVDTNNLPTGSVRINQYDRRWGWGLALPENMPISASIGNHYMFYEYVEGVEGVQSTGVIPWIVNDTKLIESMPLTAWTGDNGYAEQIISEQLMRGIGLL